MEHHESCLLILCRVCGNYIASSSTVASVYAKELKQLYNIEITNDSKQIHPTKLCSACASRMKRCRRSNNFQPMPVDVFSFKTHSDEDCSVCLQGQSVKPVLPFTSKRGRPLKRKLGGSYGGPGRGHKKPDYEQPLSPKPSTSSAEPPARTAEPSTRQMSSPTPETVKRKLLASESVEGESSTQVASVEINSVPLDRFKEHDIAEHFVCSICQGVPTVACISSCNHFFCNICIQHWLLNSSSCPSCREVLEPDDVVTLTGNNLNVYDSLQLHCKYHHLGCENISTLVNHTDHESKCKFQGKGKRSTYGKKKPKQPLRFADRQYCKQKRLKPCFDFLNSFCTTNAEDKEDVLFFLLRSILHDSFDKERAKMVEDIWSNTSSVLSVDECLALRVSNLQTKNQYKAQYDMLKDKSVNVLRPPIQLDECEKSYMPGTARYVIVGNENYEHVYRTPVKLGKESLPLSSASNSVEPEVMLEEFKNTCKEIPGPNLEGVKFSYADSIAKTLQEIEPDIRENFNSLGLPSTSAELVLRTFVKDGSDGMGDVEIYRGKGERTLPGNAFRASFAVVKSEVEIDDKRMVVFEQENPNSVKCNRPLIQAIADENCESTLNYCLLPMEAE